MMGKIYKNSHQTIVWLGSAPNQAQKSAVETVNSFTPFYQEIEAKAKQQLAAIRARESYTTEKRSDDSERLYGLVSLLSVSGNSTLLSEGISAAALPPTLDYYRVQDILELFQLEYFIRLWPVQEIVLSRRKTIYLGVFQFVWNLVGWFSGFFIHKYRHLDIKEDKLDGIQAAMWVYSYARTPSTGFPFAIMLRATRRFQATVTKDQVYALYGMI
ncbi:hypothetical protein EDB81DRAFT_762042 [Dactylonectria macrodidyma]|uniref:Heterokaryon incompatibility domain-containing protein n=1 Tax=Dactylonectria macrodidyma TaxID=307937 RepID=A0A9P9EFW2_9HYPO|nr:hypothetical protein EDB81DRAFT_762042 [Dactylonectria macrodidyma]